MSDTNLITQAVVANLEIAIAQVQTNLDAVELQLNTALTNHENLTYSVAHGGLFASVQDYRDTGGDTVGRRVIKLTILGTDYFVPADPLAIGPYVPPPPPPPPPPSCDCHVDSCCLD